MQDTLTPWLAALDIPAELPAAPAYDWLTDATDGYDASYDLPPLDPTDRFTQALLRARAAVQASQEARTRRLIRDELLLRRLMAQATPQEQPPVRECEPGPGLRWGYRGLMP